MDGFTLIETLLVILILGILMAIVLPGFGRQRDSALDAEAKTYVRDAVGAMEAFQAENATYDASTAEVLDLAPELQDAAAWSATGTKKAYEVQVRSDDGRLFGLKRRANGRIERDCAPAGGGCRPDGTW